VHQQPWKECLVFTSTMMELQQADDAAQLCMHNINQIRNRLPYFFCTISYWQTKASTKSTVIRQAGLPHSAAVRGYPDRVSIHPKSSHPFLFPSCHQKGMMIKKRKESTHLHLVIFTYFFTYTYRFVQYPDTGSNRKQLRLGSCE
jgi:hypothetical protein